MDLKVFCAAYSITSLITTIKQFINIAAIETRFYK